MKNSVLKAAGYILVHTPEMLLQHGTTQTTEQVVNPDSDYLKELPNRLRSYEECLAYPPNQTYIGNFSLEELSELPEPWYDKKAPSAERFGKFGEIMPEDEFLALMRICDAFDLVRLEKNFAAEMKEKLSKHPLFTEAQLSQIKEGLEVSEIEKTIAEEGAEGLLFEGKTVGYVKKAHAIDVNLSAHVMYENLVSKASAVLSVMHLMKNSGLDLGEVDYVIECGEEACGDMNQRGGGNFAKAIAEVVGLVNATGSDTRSFCAGPAHALVEAASLVRAGTYRNVVVVGGGSSAKLGMNGKDHLRKDIPILEDCLGGFAVLVSENDGESPEINTHISGRHKVGTGSSPQAVTGSLVTEPLAAAGLKITDIDKFAPELQNPDITKPAGAGDVPEANYKMIAAMGVRLGDIERADINAFVEKHGIKGFAPTQGHIPSAVPYMGFAREDIMSGKYSKVMFVGKGSLFLGRMTNLFDGVSFIVQKNTTAAKAGDDAVVPSARPVIGIAIPDSEHGAEEVKLAADIARKQGYAVKIIEGDDVHGQMEAMLADGSIAGAVTTHYPFPIGVSTIGRVKSPARGRDVYLAATTGTSATDRNEAMVRNAIYGIIAAKAAGVEKPTVGILNVDGARQCERALLTLKENGYDINFSESVRADGGAVMRGNDLLQGAADVLVCDALTGNILVKLLSAYSTGGSYEALGDGYGPGIGENYGKLIMIVSRASGAPVIAGAAAYASALAEGDFCQVARDEFAKAKRAGLEDVLKSVKATAKADGGEEAGEIKMPPKETCTSSIEGIEVMDIEDAAAELWKAGIYAETGMGCTGPIVMMSDANYEKSVEILQKAGYIK